MLLAFLCKKVGGYKYKKTKGMTEILRKRKAQKPFINREIHVENLKKDYEKFKIRLQKERGLS